LLYEPHDGGDGMFPKSFGVKGGLTARPGKEKNQPLDGAGLAECEPTQPYQKPRYGGPDGPGGGTGGGGSGGHWLSELHASVQFELHRPP
jgi:hypothetical protein